MDTRIVAPTTENLRTAAQKLRNGGLVAFPTETVYGLGASLWHEEALRRIFSVKGRPFEDPLIVHVLDCDAALSLAAVGSHETAIVRTLAGAFWPGPLTLVLPAAPAVPRVVTAGGDTVGVRCPAHPVARAFLELAGVPVPAPSANRFAHVSPTRAEHVMADLGSHDLLVVDGGPCEFGIESTVARLEKDALVVLRRGAVTVRDLETAFAAAGLQVAVRVADACRKQSEIHEGPGLYRKHYSPEIPSAILKSDVIGRAPQSEWSLGTCAVVDFGGRALTLRERVAAYVDLSPRGEVLEAAQSVFGIMRELELRTGLEGILLPDISDLPEETRALAVMDRLWRAADGRSAVITEDVVRVFCESP